MTDYPDDVYAPSSLAQVPAETDLDPIETNPSDPPGDLYLMSRRLGQRLRNVTGTTKRTLRLMS